MKFLSVLLGCLPLLAHAFFASYQSFVGKHHFRNLAISQISSPRLFIKPAFHNSIRHISMAATSSLDPPSGIEVEDHQETKAEDVENSIFGNMGLLPDLCKGLTNMKISIPTSIQEASLPLSLAGESVLLCAETGSGKTLAFLLPLVQRLKIDEQTLGISARARRPRALVLVPTRELGHQILSVAKELSHAARFSSFGAFGGCSVAEQARRLQSPVDLLVGTPGRLSELASKGDLVLGDVRFLVADEADTMASQGFATELRKLFHSVVSAAAAARNSYNRAQELMAHAATATTLSSADAATIDDTATALTAATPKDALAKQLRAMRGPFQAGDRGQVQCVLAAATVGPGVRQIMIDTFPRHREVRTEQAHKVSKQVTQDFIPVNSMEKPERLVEAVLRGLRMNTAMWAKPRALEGTPVRAATLVFCNTRDSALYAARLLRERLGEEAGGVAELHGWVPQSERAGHAESFAQGRSRVLVATDIMARGIDTVQVAHVVNFDFPLNPVDYLHRIGRTGRGGGTGRVTNLVARCDAPLAAAIERASREGRAVDHLTSHLSDYVPGQPGLLKADAPPPRAAAPKPPRSAPRRSATPRAPATRRSKPKDTSMKKYRDAQPKKRR